MKNVVRKLTPYEQLTLNVDKRSVKVETPWLILDCEVDKAQDSNLTAVLKELYSYPICYIHPRKPVFRDAKQVLLGVLNKKSSDWQPLDIEKKIWPNHLDEVSWIKDLAFEWDVSEVLNFSRIGSLNLFDSLSAYSVLRRSLHISLIDLGERGLHEKLEQLKTFPEKFRIGIASVINQNLYITKQCSTALTPAVEQFPNIGDKISDYITSEAGHDVFIKKSLNILGFPDPNKLTFLPETKFLMEILKYSSSSNILAFAILIDFFESGSTSKVHPFAMILEGTQFASAGGPLQRHRDINVGESHSSIAINFLLTPSTCSAREVTDAVRLTELAVMTKRQMISKMLEYCNSLLGKEY